MSVVDTEEILAVQRASMQRCRVLLDAARMVLSAAARGGVPGDLDQDRPSRYPSSRESERPSHV